MKGLLLKDFYMTLKYCKTHLALCALFVVLIYTQPESSAFFLFYPCLLMGMLPITLLAYDERSGWETYSATLPYRRSDVVAGKYIVALIAQVVCALLVSAAQTARQIQNGTLSWPGILGLMFAMLLASMISTAVILPCVFKMGVEKGRIAYYIVIVAVVGLGGFLMARIPTELLSATLSKSWLPPVLAHVCAAVFALSWAWSVVFYRKREL